MELSPLLLDIYRLKMITVLKTYRMVPKEVEELLVAFRFSPFF
jgi:hypothetical protein